MKFFCCTNGARPEMHKYIFHSKIAPYIESWSTPSLNKKFKKNKGEVKLFIFFSHFFKNTKQEGNDGDGDDDDEADEGSD